MAVNNANVNLNHINIVEGLIYQIHGHLQALLPHTEEQIGEKNSSIAGLSGWEKTQLFALRREFEK